MSALQSILFGARFQYKDATGKRWKLYDQFQQVGSEPPIPPAVFNSIRAECDSYELTQTQHGFRVFFVILGVWQIVNVLVNARTTSAPIRDGVVGVGVTGIFWCLALCYSKLVRASPEVYGNELLAHARCAACGYPLRPAQSPTTTCSECGAVWQTSKVAPIPNTQPAAPAE